MRLDKPCRKNITNETEEKKIVYDNNIMNIKDKDEYYKHKEINIEYRDENGKKLRPKEMARYQALIFHGEKSSVRKREKKLLREKYQVFVQNPNSNKTLNYMNFVKDKNNQAFATLQALQPEIRGYRGWLHLYLWLLHPWGS